MSFSRSDFIADIESKLEEIRENYLSERDKTDKAFCYMIAEMFEPGSMDPAEDIFEYTDGKSDHGIDFAIQRNNTFRIYQCKSIEDPSKYPSGKTWGADPVNELAEAIDFMMSDERPNASKAVSRLRDSYQLNREDHLLTAVLAIEGKLSEEGMERWNAVRENYEEAGVSLRLIGEKETSYMKSRAKP